MNCLWGTGGYSKDGRFLALPGFTATFLFRRYCPLIMLGSSHCCPRKGRTWLAIPTWVFAQTAPEWALRLAGSTQARLRCRLRFSLAMLDEIFYVALPLRNLIWHSGRPFN